MRLLRPFLLSALAAAAAVASPGRPALRADLLFAPVPAVDTNDRQAVINLYKYYAAPTFWYYSGWTGNLAAGFAGTLSNDYQRATLQMVNYARSMAGVNSQVNLDQNLTPACQDGALILAANNSLSHYPPSYWLDWTPDGAWAVSNSNIASGAAGPSAVLNYMLEPGNDNTAVGHRRWVLYPGERTMGHGAINSGWFGPTYDVLDVLADWNSVPDQPRDGFVSWPSPNYFPSPLLPTRWSFTVRNADFSGAVVSIWQNGVPIYGMTVYGQDNDYADNTLVWDMPLGSINSWLPNEVAYTVQINNVMVNGAPQQYSYTVRTISFFSLF